MIEIEGQKAQEKREHLVEYVFGALGHNWD